MCLKECELWNASLALRGFICITPVIPANRSKSKSEPEWDSCCWGPRVHKNKHFRGASVVNSSTPMDQVLVSRWWSPTEQMSFTLSKMLHFVHWARSATWYRMAIKRFAPKICSWSNQSSNIKAPNETRALLSILPETAEGCTFPCCIALNFTLLNLKSMPLGLHSLKYRETRSD